MGDPIWKIKKKGETSENSNVEDLIRRRTLNSLMKLNSDSEVNEYLREMVTLIAKLHSKEVTDFTPKDLKRCIDQIYLFLEKVNLHEVSLKQLEVLKNLSDKGGELSTLFTFSKAVAGLASGKIGYLAWHISKEVSKPRIKRALIVYICGLLANSLYGGNLKDLEFKERLLDPIFEAMNRDMLDLLASQLSIAKIQEKSDNELLDEISNSIASEGKDQSITRAWFPKDAASYLEVLVVVAKKIEVDIKGLSSVEEIETAICIKVFSEIWEKLPDDKKNQLAAELKVEGNKISPEYITSMASLGAIGLANLGGFSTYLAGSMSLSFLASSLGFTIPFAGYTSLSSAIYVAIGPVGAIAASLPAVFEWLRAKPEKLVSVIITVAICRARLINEGKLDAQRERRSIKMRRIWFALGIGILSGVTSFATYLIFK